MCFSFKLDPFIEQSETLEKMGAERPGVLVTSKITVCMNSNHVPLISAFKMKFRMTFRMTLRKTLRKTVRKTFRKT